MGSVAGWAAIILGGLAAVIGLYAAFGIDIRDNQDMFIQDLHAQGRWTAAAAVCAGLAVVAQALEKLLG
jgi:hypothetical protein